jgi:signal transduction histidine kinase
MSSVLRTGRTCTYQIRIVGPSGTTSWSCRLAPIRTAEEITGFLSVGREIPCGGQDRPSADTHHARRLEDLAIMAGGIAHDFNNLLTAILGNADLCMMELPADSPGREAVAEIKKASARAAELSDQILAYAGKGRLLAEGVDLNEPVGEMARLVETDLSQRIDLVYEPGEELGLIDADPAQVRQLAMKLLTNAAEAIGENPGTITVRTRVTELSRADLDGTCIGGDLSPGRYVSLEVSDTGCGMDPHARARLFVPFFTTKSTGRGLGLAVVLGIIRSHGGTISVASEVGQGTTFTVFFRSREQAPAEPPGAQAELPARAGWWPGGRILVVDDQKAVTTVARNMLESAGFSVLTTGDGREAIDVFRERADEITAVLLNLTMPDVSGEDVFHEMRRIRPDAKIILTSGYAEPEATAQLASEGLAGFLQKPFQLKTLLQRLRDALE